MLDCLLTPEVRACARDEDVCFTEVIDQKAGRQIRRGCATKADAFAAADKNSAECVDIESHVLSDGAACTIVCDGHGSPNCNHAPQLMPDQGLLRK